jgi:hypothetical protein
MAQLPPSTAEVIEFRCQYTHNVTQKRKKWNDGTLKFHTFNKLVRVFDEEGNHCGQKHWQGDFLQDGDEFLLENILVSVQDQLRSTQTNLAPLFDRRKKQSTNDIHGHHDHPRISHVPRAHTQAPEQNFTAPQNVPRQTHSSASMRSKHRSLNSLLGAPRGPVGKALAPKSLFELRNSEDIESHADGPAAKRKRIGSISRDPWTVTTTTNGSAAQPVNSPKRTLGSSLKLQGKRKLALGTASSHLKAAIGQQTLNIKYVVDLTTDSSPERTAKDAEAGKNSRYENLNHALSRSAERLYNPRDISPLASTTRESGSTTNKTDSSSMLPPPTKQDLSHPGLSHPGEVCRTSTSSKNGSDKHKQQPRPKNSLLQRRDDNGKGKAFALSTAKRKPMLMCMQSNNYRKEPVEENIVILDGEYSEGPESSKKKDMMVLDGSESEDVMSDPIEFPSCPPNQIISCGETRGSSTRRPPLQDIVQRSNRLFRQQSDLTEMLGQPQEKPQYSPRRGSLGRSRSDPTAMNYMQSLGVNSRNPATVVNQNRSRTMYMRAQTMTAATAQYQAPTTIFTQLPPEVDPDKEDLGPWSREALDLFDWRPPNWEERLASKPPTIGMVD